MEIEIGHFVCFDLRAYTNIFWGAISFMRHFIVTCLLAPHCLPCKVNRTWDAKYKFKSKNDILGNIFRFFYALSVASCILPHDWDLWIHHRPRNKQKLLYHLLWNTLYLMRTIPFPRMNQIQSFYFLFYAYAAIH